MKSFRIVSLAIACLYFSALSMAVEEDDTYQLINVQVSGQADILRIQSLHLEIKKFNSETNELEVVIPASERAAFDELNLTFEVLIEDMAAFYEARLLADPGVGDGRAFPDGSMGGFYTLSEIEGLLDDWAVQYPHLITPKQSIGQTIEGRDIWLVKISDNPTVDENEPEVCFDSLIHAREVSGMMTVIYYMMQLLEQYNIDPELTYLVDNREIWFIPCLNPDGYIYNETTNPNGGGMWRKSRRDNGDGTFGVDLNRNFSFKWGYDDIGSSPIPGDIDYRGTGPFSEPESTAARNFLLSRPIKTHWNTHTYGNMYLCPFGYDDVLPYGQDWDIFQEYLADISAVNGYAAGTVPQTIGYYANGTALDWSYEELGAFCITPEIGSEFWPSTSEILPLVLENLMPIKYWTWMGGSYMQLTGHSAADANGDGNIHPGEPVDLVIELRNKGLGATLSDVVVTVASSSPYVTLQHDTVNFGTVDSYTLVDNGFEPFELTVSSWAPYGESLPIDVEIVFDDYIVTQQVILTAGVANVFLADDFETHQGWTVQNQSVSTGAFVRADPAGTDAQPEDDHTDIGTICYVTGSAGGSIGDDDLDGGPTRLLSPVLDLSSGDAEVSFWYYFYHSTNGTFEPLEVHITNGGAWQLVTDFAHTPAWSQFTFKVSDYVTPTANVQIRFSAEDNPNDSIVEALIDDFEVKSFTAPVELNLIGTPAIGSTVNIGVSAPSDAGLGYFMAASTITYPVIPIGDRYFPLGWDGFVTSLSINQTNPIFQKMIGYLDGTGYSSDPKFVIPPMTSLKGLDIFFGACTLDAGSPEGVKNLSAPLPITIE